MNLSLCLYLVLSVVCTIHCNPKQDIDEGALDAYIESLPDNVFDDTFEGDGNLNDESFNHKLDELLQDYKSRVEKSENNQMETESEDKKNTNVEEEATVENESEDQSNVQAPANDETSDLKEEESEEVFDYNGVDTRPELDETMDAENFYPIISDEEFKIQEKKDLDELASARALDEPTNDEEFDEETMKKKIEEAFREQSFDNAGIDTTTAHRDSNGESEESDEKEENETSQNKKEYTGSDILEDIPGLENDFSDLHQIESMGKIQDPFVNTFEKYDKQRRALAEQDDD